MKEKQNYLVASANKARLAAYGYLAGAIGAAAIAGVNIASGDKVGFIAGAAATGIGAYFGKEALSSAEEAGRDMQINYANLNTKHREEQMYTAIIEATSQLQPPVSQQKPSANE